MKFDTEICKDVSCLECSFNKGEYGCLLAKRLDEIEITPEPCEDAVSREAVHNMLENMPIGLNEKWFNWLQKACLRLAELPSVTPKQRWIPCSERLPEVGTYVLISKKALSFKSNLPNVCTAHRSCDSRSGKEEWNDMLFGKLDDDDVLAWMPLPESYKGNEEGEQE